MADTRSATAPRREKKEQEKIIATNIEAQTRAHDAGITVVDYGLIEKEETSPPLGLA